MPKFNSKIKDIKNLALLIRRFKSAGKKVVLAHGSFDLFHHGHMHYLNEAKKQGDILVVSVVADRFVRKGFSKPIFNELTRLNSIAFLSPVDYVVLCNDFGPWEIIKKLRPNIYVKGKDSESQLDNPKSGVGLDKRSVESAGGKMVFTKTLQIPSENVLNKHFSAVPNEAISFLTDFKKKYNVSDILINLEKLKKTKVLAIGESIIDEYRYVSPLGKPAKSHVVSTHFKEKEEFAGGILACANHLASICGQVELVTVLGEKKSEVNLLRRNLKPNVKTKFFYCPGQKTIVKRRFLDEGSFVKFFEEYEFDKGFIPKSAEQSIKNYLADKIADFDLVVAVDYGHGLFSPDLIKLIISKSKFLAVTAQTNSGNAGFNYITKYLNADYVSMDELEARLAAHDDYSPIEKVISKLFKKISPKQMIVTLGRQGLIVRDKSGETKKMPSLANRITDAVGAGDAFLCISAPCAAAGFSADLTSFIGNVAASIAVDIVGNRSSVEREELFGKIGYLLE